VPAPAWFYVVLALGIGAIVLIYWLWNWERLQIFKLLLASFFPLALLILAVLGSIVVGLATPAEAAAVGAFGGFAIASSPIGTNGRAARRPARCWGARRGSTSA
jgi:TRAP-type mannitol/chloroaromatic compound transport system permease large subunit